MPSRSSPSPLNAPNPPSGAASTVTMPSRRSVAPPSSAASARWDGVLRLMVPAEEKPMKKRGRSAVPWSCWNCATVATTCVTVAGRQAAGPRWTDTQERWRREWNSRAAGCRQARPKAQEHLAAMGMPRPRPGKAAAGSGCLCPSKAWWNRFAQGASAHQGPPAPRAPWAPRVSSRLAGRRRGRRASTSSSSRCPGRWGPAPARGSPAPAPA
jgi:hypothetical protein